MQIFQSCYTAGCFSAHLQEHHKGMRCQNRKDKPKGDEWLMFLIINGSFPHEHYVLHLLYGMASLWEKSQASSEASPVNTDLQLSCLSDVPFGSSHF